jgi:hypothetical protein
VLPPVLHVFFANVLRFQSALLDRGAHLLVFRLRHYAITTANSATART